MVRFYSCDFRLDTGAKYISITEVLRTEQTTGCKQSTIVVTAAQAVFRQLWRGGSLLRISFPSFWILSLSPLKGSSKERSVACYKWLHIPPAGENMMLGNRSRSHPSLRHFPGPVPKDARLPEGHHHPPWGNIEDLQQHNLIGKQRDFPRDYRVCLWSHPFMAECNGEQERQCCSALQVMLSSHTSLHLFTIVSI